MMAEDQVSDIVLVLLRAKRLSVLRNSFSGLDLITASRMLSNRCNVGIQDSVRCSFIWVAFLTIGIVTKQLYGKCV